MQSQTKSFKGSLEKAQKKSGEYYDKLITDGYTIESSNYEQGRRGFSDYIAAMVYMLGVFLIVLFAGLPLFFAYIIFGLIFLYLITTKPAGKLVVTYRKT